VTSTSDSPRTRSGSFAHRVRTAVAIVAVIAVLLLAAWRGRSVLLLAFAGVLLGVLLCGLTETLRRRTGWRHGIALGVVVALLLALVAGTCWLAAPSISQQVDQLAETLPQAFGDLRGWLGQTRWGQWLLARTPDLQDSLTGGGSGGGGVAEDVFSRVTGIASTALAALSGVVIVLFLGLYLAVEPRLYTGGLVRLVPKEHRGRAREVLATLYDTLKWWLVARFSSMAVIGVLTWIGLAALGIPLAFVLAVLAAVLTFVPYAGPVLSAIPPALLALADRPMKAVWVLVLFLAIQTIESYLVTPLIERKAVRLPPALTIVMQVLITLLAGPLGLLLASPLVAVGMVLVQTLYVEDALGDTVENVGAGH
jgi:predicted PurR-regulated permease PerM